MGSRIKALQAQFRTMLMGVQGCLGTRIGLGNAVISWLVFRASTTLNKYKMDTAGHTAYQRVTGGTQRKPLAKFREQIWYIPNGRRDPGAKAGTFALEGFFYESKPRVMRRSLVLRTE